MKKSKPSLPTKVRKGKVSVLDRLRVLDRTQRHAVIATDFNGLPYTSLIAFALTPDMKHALFITPKSTRKYLNILKNNRVSLLIDTRTNTERDYMGAESITILGNARPVRKGNRWTVLAGILTKKHPRLSEVIDSPDTALVAIKITRCIHVTKFQSVTVWPSP